MTTACVTQVSDDLFEQEVLNHDGPVVVDFFTPTCPPCRMMSPIMEALCTERGADLKVVKINAAEQQRVAIDHDIQAVPTFFLYLNGRRLAECRGSRTKQDFEKWIDDNLDRVR